MKKILLLLSISLFIYSIINIFIWFKDSNSIAKESEKLSNTANSITTNQSANTLTTSNTENTINFTNLKEINSDIIGWIKVNGTEIDYPIVQTTDNNYYLTHSYNKEENKSGSIFLDYRNDINNFSENTIIYGHSRYDTSMFGSLRNCLKQSWLKNKNNHKIYLTTENGESTWSIFSVYHIKYTTDYLATTFSNSDEYKKFIKLIKNRSIYNFNTQVSDTDKILTLSTCYRTNDRMVVHAKLVK